MSIGSLLLLLLSLRPGRVDVDPVRGRGPVAQRAVEAARTVVRQPEAAPASEGPTRPQPTFSILPESTVPHANARAVNSWFDFESYLSDLSGYREILGDESYHEELIRVTAEFLELPAQRVPAFESTLRVVQGELQGVQREMGKVLASYPVDLNDEQLRKIQSETDLRYRRDRDRALARFDEYLDARSRHREFRSYLEYWVTNSCGLE
ncbi:MAG TPA: hypothetical protein VE981_09530 [Planctomycetota bacterium]|nr:hypothetical protein [Planctomycetota bacterium]